MDVVAAYAVLVTLCVVILFITRVKAIQMRHRNDELIATLFAIVNRAEDEVLLHELSQELIKSLRDARQECLTHFEEASVVHPYPIP